MIMDCNRDEGTGRRREKQTERLRDEETERNCEIVKLSKFRLFDN